MSLNKPDIEFKLIQNSFNKETSSFEEFINELKDNLNSTIVNESSSISLTDSVIVYCPLLEVPIGSKMEFDVTVCHYLVNEASDCLKCVKHVSIDTSIEHIIYETLFEMGFDYTQSGDYMLKIHGKEEYLPMDATVCQLRYIRDCLCLNIEPVFVLVKAMKINKALSFKRISEEFIDKTFYFELNVGNLNLIVMSKLEDALAKIMAKRLAIKESENKVSLIERCEEFLHSLAELQALVRSKIAYTPFSSLTVSLKVAITDSDLGKAMKIVDELMRSCVKYCNCASKCFDWNFELEDFDIQEPLLINESNEKFSIYFESVSNLGTEMVDSVETKGIRVFYVRLSIYYGTLKLDEVSSNLVQYNTNSCSIEIHDLYKLVFQNIPFCQLPREAILLIQFLESIQTTENQKHEKCLAWASKALINENLVMEGGEMFCCMYPGDSIVTHTSALNYESDKAPIVYLSILNKTTIIPSVHLPSKFKNKNFKDLLDCEQKQLMDICNRNITITPLIESDKIIIRKYANYLHGKNNRIPNALSKTYLSLAAYDRKTIAGFHDILKQYDVLSISEALEFLLPHYPDTNLRKLAIKSLGAVCNETLLLYLPQLLQALKYEHSNSSALAQMLLKCAAQNIRFAHRLYWYLRELKSTSNDICTYRFKYDLIYQGLVYLFPDSMIQEITQECLLVDTIDDIAQRVKNTKNLELLRSELQNLLKEWPEQESCRLPFDISAATNGIDINLCSYISSFTVPLKLVFKNVDSTASNFYTIYKVGDDLRQDMFVLQLINIMNQLWILNNHDLSVLTFNCLQTGDKRGFIEMITNAETLKEIQGSAINAFKKSIINGWLKSHNPLPQNFYKAVDNFTKSCAAYSVATYILGIGDRHNDNVMVKYSGHMFHIDFGKYLGDAQMFAGIYKRDRAPMLFTQDMFYVVNQSAEISARFLDFIDICCTAFQILRENHSLILSLMELLIESNIPGLNKEAVTYVYKSLMINLSDDEAREAFTNMILVSSNTFFSTINFAIHTLAQPSTLKKKTLRNQNFNSSVDNTSGIVNVDMSDETLQSAQELLYKCIVLRENNDLYEIYRTFNDFCSLYEIVAKELANFNLSLSEPYKKFKENTNRVASITSLIADILKTDIKNSPLIYTFFNRTTRDHSYFTADHDLLFEDATNTIRLDDNIKGQVKLKLKYVDNKLKIMVFFARYLKSPKNQITLKTSLTPDPKKVSKQKIQSLNDGACPIFNQTIDYSISISEINCHDLEIFVNDGKLINKFVASSLIQLRNIDWNKGEVVKWIDLV